MQLFVLDFEGTSHGVFEHGHVLLDTSQPLPQAIQQVSTALYSPHILVDDPAFQLCRVSMRDLESLPRLEQSNLLKETRDALNNSYLLAAHNSVTEREILKRYWPFEPTFQTLNTKNTVDSLLLARHLAYLERIGFFSTSGLFQVGDFSLSSLLKPIQHHLEKLVLNYPQIKRAHYHSAGYDALATALLIWTYTHTFKLTDAQLINPQSIDQLELF